MLKKTITFFLFLFLTQAVLAGIDLHHAPVNNNSAENGTTNILHHYVDTHALDYSVEHPCSYGSQLADSSLDTENNHHHDCHGHTTSYSFTHISLTEENHTSFFTHYTYFLSDYSVILSSPKRPPILS